MKNNSVQSEFYKRAKKVFEELKDTLFQMNNDFIEIKKKIQELELKYAEERLIFPIDKIINDYHTYPSFFGAHRDNGRLHAGCDLQAPFKTPIRAMKKGIIKRIAPFYKGTFAMEIDHGDFIGRYCEIEKGAKGLKTGSTVKAGQIIAYVGQMIFNSSNKMSMLHLEMYSKDIHTEYVRGVEITPPLTQRSKPPYKRRLDLIDPTPFLDNAIRIDE